MKRSLMHLTLVKLIMIVVAAAVSLAALRSASPIWVDALLMLTYAAIGFAILAALYREGGCRAYWLGFVLFTGGYHWLAFEPGTAPAPTPKLLTGRLLVALYARSRVASSPGQPDLPAPAVQYLNAARQLQAMGNNNLAAKYCRVAFDYRDSLSDEERNQLIAIQGMLGPEEIAILTAESNTRVIVPKVTIEDFERTGHCLLGLAAGCLGGVIGLSLFHSRPSRATSESSTPVL